VEEILAVWFRFYCVQVLAQVAVRIREAVSKIHAVVIAVEGMGESQSVVLFVWETVAVHLIADLVLVVADVGANAVPPRLVLLKQILTIRQYSHTLVIQTIRFSQIDYVEPDLLTFPRVRNPEKVPLCVTVGIDVVLENEVVLIFADFDCN
jgi:hypothetical protein